MPTYHITFIDKDGHTRTTRQSVTTTGNPTRDRSAAIREAKFARDVRSVLSAVKLPKPLRAEDYR